MKRVLIAIAIIASSLIARGAICQWALNRVGNDLNGASAVGATAYLINVATVSLDDMTTALSTDNGWEALLAKADDKVTLTEQKVTQNGVTTIYGRVSSTTVQEGDVAKDYANGNYTFYAVIINNAEDNYMITKTIDGTAGPLSNISASFGSQASKTWQPIPEPTSGLLMLIGASLLALRRKQK